MVQLSEILESRHILDSYEKSKTVYQSLRFDIPFLVSGGHPLRLNLDEQSAQSFRRGVFHSRGRVLKFKFSRKEVRRVYNPGTLF